MNIFPSLRLNPSRFLGLIAITIGCATSMADPNNDNPALPLDNDYALRAGDRIQVTVFNEPDLDTQQKLDPDGVVVLPMLGRVDLLGKSPRAAEAFLEQKFIEEQYLIDPQVTIAIIEYAQQRFYVFGEVNSPGAKAIPQGRQWIDILEAISMAGDLSEFAKRGDILLRRPIPGTDNEKRIPINLDQLIRGNQKSDSQQIRIFPDDIIYVPERMF